MNDSYNNTTNTTTVTGKATPKQRAHLVGLTGLPRPDDTLESPSTVSLHSVPIKIFHEVPEVGLVLSVWLEQLLESGKLKAPPPVATEEGFEGVNRGLRTMRENGGRVVVRI